MEAYGGDEGQENKKPHSRSSQLAEGVISKLLLAYFVILLAYFVFYLCTLDLWSCFGLPNHCCLPTNGSPTNTLAFTSKPLHQPSVVLQAQPVVAREPSSPEDRGIPLIIFL